ncbi:ABC transporter permease ['Camptotheca acuminata' phytoplasma]|uniref:ABC transporter permease n=1 Tax='Camptotheca acuminata' phytoplasma TaxID=3239192 RepID=UPI00351A0608
MTKFYLKKFFYTGLIFLTVIFISFFSMKLIPGDPIDALFGQRRPTPEQRQTKEKELGLDVSLFEQFSKYLKNIFLKFDFGNSYYGDKTKALNMFWEAFQNTLQISLLSCFLGSFIGIFLGVLASFWQDTKKSFLLDFFSILMISLPTFVIGFLLQIIFGNYFRILPLSGFNTWKYMILPISTLSLYVSGSVFKTTLNSMNESLEQPYIVTAYAKGLSKKNIIFKHALKNALIPIIAHIGLILSFLVGGSIITESIFNIKGIGDLIISSFEKRDFPVIQCCIILLALFISIVNLFLDLIYFWLDPKINKKS